MPSPALAKVDDKVSAAALQALQNLTKHTKRCAAFVYEVDPEELGLVNYFDIIAEPMHLDLVREKLEVTFVDLMLAFARFTQTFLHRKKSTKTWANFFAM